MVRERLHVLALGCEDLNDHQTLRHDAGLQTAASSTSPLASPANQFRILLSGLAYTLFEGLRRMALGDTDLARASPNRIRAAATAAAPIPDRPGLPPLPDQTLRRLERDARRGDEEPKHHALVALAEAPIAEAFQRVPNEAVGLVPIPRLEVHRLVAFHEGAKLPDCA